MEASIRRLPEGIQSFGEIRRGGYIYVDKTDLVWKLANGSKYNYLSRPRRFGKTLLINTLQCYFEGKKELFEGLRIMELEKEWTAYPVIRLDMSIGGETADDLKDYLSDKFSEYEQEYGIVTSTSISLTVRFKNIVVAAARKAGQPAVILIDEYDFPLQHTWMTDEHEKCTKIYRSVFTVLKSETDNIRFVFITGVTKFTQVSLFSALNNLTNISFLPQYATLCGMTRDEIVETFTPEIERLATKKGWTVEETMGRLKDFYDGYHFSCENMVDVYNPYSMVLALSHGNLNSYWASTGPTILLQKFVDGMVLRMNNFEGCCVPKFTLESSDVKTGADALFLYQSGYLTIKGYDDDAMAYTLGFPNTEVREALYGMVLPALSNVSDTEIENKQSALRKALKLGNLDNAMEALKGLVADVPYSNKRMHSMYVEERYRLIISNVIAAVGLRVEVEHMMAGGRVDVVAWGKRFIYVVELKLTKAGGLVAAERQILDNGYARAFEGEGREVVALAIELEDEGRGLVAWKRVNG